MAGRFNWYTRWALNKRSVVLLQSLFTDGMHIPPASVDTVPELADWVKAHPYQRSVDNQSSTVSALSSSSPEVESKETETGDFPQDERCDTPLRPVSQQSFQSYLFPVSNSPVDLITMLTRLASFTGTIINVLTPRLPRSSLRVGINVSIVCIVVVLCP